MAPSKGSHRSKNIHLHIDELIKLKNSLIINLFVIQLNSNRLYEFFYNTRSDLFFDLH